MQTGRKQDEDAEHALDDWLESSRYVTARRVHEARLDPPIVTPAFPKRRLNKDQKDAIIAAIMILLLVAGSAFLAGLL